jgi:biopolymer transport protein ExbD
MAKVQIKKKSVFIDMTAMSDVTVLLLTFFMLTSTFVKKAPVTVTTPGSVSEIKIPEKDILSILIAKDGKVFMSLDKQADMAATLESVGADYGVKFSPAEIKKFQVQSTFGIPIAKMKSFLALDDKSKDGILKSQGIPTDSTNNQFKVWIKHAHEVNPDLRIAIKADQDTPYKVIKDVMNSLLDLKENRYNLITTLKVVPKEAK